MEKVEQKAREALTSLWQHAPVWMQDNRDIHSGYRSPSASVAKSFASLGYLHNESVNIWSHLLGALGFIGGSYLLWTTLTVRYAAATSEDVAVFACFFGSAVACLGMSATYHTLNNHSQSVAVFANQLDYLGIVFLIWGSFIPSIHYGFGCDPTIRKTYYTMITTIGAGCAVVAVNPSLRKGKNKAIGAGMFVAMGLTAVFPVWHGVFAYGLEHMVKSIGLPWLVTQGALYILGAAIYAARVPEKWYPGSFDIWGSSHQIFHVLVVTAACVHLVGLVKAFDFYHSHPLSRCPST